jgi:hypothetical protein
MPRDIKAAELTFITVAGRSCEPPAASQSSTLHCASLTGRSIEQRALHGFPAGGDQLATTLPGGHDGEGADADEQGQPRAVGQLGEVGGQE